MTEAVGKPRQFHEKFKFQIDIDNIGRASCQSISELKADISKIEYREGGMLIPYKEPGSLSYNDITITRAVTEDVSLYGWLGSVANAVKHTGLRTSQFKREATIVQFGRDGDTIRTWVLSGCWPVSVSVGAWDNNTYELNMESIVLAYDYFVIDKNIAPSGKPENPLEKLTSRIVAGV